VVGVGDGWRQMASHSHIWRVSAFSVDGRDGVRFCYRGNQIRLARLD
jgi:hypothetical protein